MGRVQVLLSGGIDSATCLGTLASENHTVSALFFDYGQPSAIPEARAARRVSKHYGVPLKTIKCKGFVTEPGLILGRNAFLLFGALMDFKHSSGLIAIGIHKGTNYVDCSTAFFKLCRSMFSSYASGRISVLAPFSRWTKGDIYQQAQSIEVPLELTYSCERGAKQPCHKCSSCADLRALYAN